MVSEQGQSNYRWYILVLGTITHIFVASMPMFCMPVLFKEISLNLNLDLVQLGIVWGLANLPLTFGAFAAGLISDKFGATRTLGAASLLVAIAGSLRGVSGDFSALATTTFLFGLFGTPLALATHKAAGEWFSEKQLGLANGILAGGFGLGNMLGALTSATFLSPLLGSWRNVMFAFGVVAAVVGILWLAARRSPTSTGISHFAETVPFRQALLQVIRIKAVWLIALFQMGVTAYSFGVIGYLPLYLRSIGWTGIGADGALAAFGLASVLAVVPLSLLSDKIGLRKPVLYGALFMAIAGVALLTAFSGSAVWIGAIMAGLAQEAYFGISITMLIETKGVGPAYAGTALGLVIMFSGLGGFFSPPIGNGLAEINPHFGLLFWLGLAIATLVIFFFTTETGLRKKSKSN
jgi:MFS family permease